MTITLTKDNYEFNRHQLDLCNRGELCKIISIEDVLTGTIEYVICSDVLSGWPMDPPSYHGTVDNGTWHKTGLGVFLLVRKTENPDGGCTLEFTDDLNPDLP